jgi:predicted permease
VLNDIRIALRSLRRAPAFGATTVLTLALAAGANTAIFAIVNAVLFEPLPFRDPDRLVAVWPGRFQSNADLLFTRERGAMFSSVAAVAPGWTLSLTGSGEPTKVTVARVSGNFFETFGADPLLGRPFTDASARPGMDGVMVLSHAFWMQRFGGDPGVIGRTIQLDGEPVEIVAVMQPAFELFGLRTDAYAPFVLDPSAWYHRLSFNLYAARLAPGRTLEQANVDYKALIQELRRERNYPDEFGSSAEVVDLRTALVGDLGPSLGILGAAVGLILLISGANLGTLQLTRAAARTRDLAIRSALGASRGRIARQLLAENACLAVTGGVTGVLIARGAMPGFVSLLPADTPRINEIAIDPAVAGLVIAASTLVGLSAGIAPALGTTRLRTALLLRLGATTQTAAVRRFRSALVSAEVAIAVILTIGAGLLLQTLWTLQRVDPGFRAPGVLTLHVQPSGSKYRNVSIAEYYDGILERLRAVPGVTAAGAIQHLPFSNYSWNIPFVPEGHVVSAGGAAPTAGARIVTAGYFAAIGQPVLAGRTIERADAARSNVAVVNEVLATKYFDSAASALGRTIRQRSGRGPDLVLTIVGVVGNVRHASLSEEPVPEVYTSVSRSSINAMMLAVRADVQPLSIVPAVREAIWSIDRSVPLSNLETMEAKIGGSLGRPRLLLTLLGSFAALGGLLAAVGVYGVVAFSVSQRWRELGIRVALGAERVRIVSSVLREASLYAAIGLAVGIPASLAGSRWMQGLVFGISVTDPITYVTIAGVTLLTVLAAALPPALRAARVDPVAALKQS